MSSALLNTLIKSVKEEDDETVFSTACECMSRTVHPFHILLLR